MIVVDASVLANVVGDDSPVGDAARNRLRLAVHVAAPDLVDVESVAVLRKRWIAKTMSDRRFKSAVEDLIALPITRYPTGQLLHRAYELRANVTPYDATYVALAEGLSCTLLTADERLARSPSITCHVEVFTA